MVPMKRGAAEPRTGQETAETLPIPKLFQPFGQIEALEIVIVTSAIRCDGRPKRRNSRLKEKGELLTLTAATALERGAADHHSNQQKCLRRGLEDPIVVTPSPSWSNFSDLTHPTIINFILLLGVFSLG